MDIPQQTHRFDQPDHDCDANIEYIRNLESATLKLDAIRATFQALLNLSNGLVPGVPSYSLTYDCHTLMVLMTLEDECINVYEEGTYLLAMLVHFAYRNPGRRHHAHPIPGAPPPETQYEALNAIIEEGVPLVKDFENHWRKFYRVLCETYDGRPEPEDQLALSNPYATYVEENIGYIGRILAHISNLDRVRVCFRAMPRLPDRQIIIETRLSFKDADGQTIVTTRGPGMQHNLWMDIYVMVELNFHLYIDVVRLGGDGSYLSIIYT